MNKNNEVSDWTEVKNGSIDVPDELMPLFNKIGMQLRFHTISGKSEVETIAHILWNAQKFFNSQPEPSNTINEPIEVGSGDKAIDEIIKTQDEWVASKAEPVEPSKEEIEKMSPEEVKKFIIDSALQPCLEALLSAFVLSECDEYIEAMCTNDATSKNYVLTFQTEELFKKRFAPIKKVEPINNEVSEAMNEECLHPYHECRIVTDMGLQCGVCGYVIDELIEYRHEYKKAEPIKDEELASKISSAIVHNKYKTSLRKEDVSIMVTDVPKAVKEIVEIAKQYAASQNSKLKDALQEAITGLEWEIEDSPEKDHKADEEKIQEWKQLI